MKEILIPCTNWHNHVIALLALVALFLLCGETDSLGYFIFIKALGLGIAYFAYRLAKYWNSKGLIDDVEE